MIPDTDLSEPLTRIVCAAIKNKRSGLVICGARHYDGVMRESIRKISILAGRVGESQTKKEDGFYDADQGFITNTGEFLTRAQAWRVARAAGQIRRLVGGQVDGPEGELFSENCY